MVLAENMILLTCAERFLLLNPNTLKVPVEVAKRKISLLYNNSVK